MSGGARSIPLFRCAIVAAMPTSKPTTVAEFFAALPEDRRKALQAVRKTILANLPDGFEEGVGGGYVVYSVPLARFPDTYNGQPLMLAALASQKSYMALYLMCVYDEPSQKRFAAEWKATGRKLDMGKACVRFKRLDDVALDVVGETIGRLGPDEYVEKYLRSRPQATRAKAKPAATNAAKTKVTRSKTGSARGERR